MSRIRMAGAPRLMTAYLIRLNRRTKPPRRGAAIARSCIGTLGAALLFIEREPVARSLEWLQSHVLVAAGLAAIGSAVTVARRRVLTRAEFARGWLAALPIRPATARWESLVLETVPASAAVLALAVISFAVAIVLSFAPGSASSAAFGVCAWLSGAVILGAMASYAIPRPEPVDLPPGSRYVPHRRTGKAGVLRPSLKALGHWPVRQMFARAQPKIVARAVVPVLVMMPLGTMADTAMVVVGVFLVAGALSLLIPAAISVSALVRRWVAPLPVRADRLMRTYLVPSLGVIAGASAVEACLLFVLGASLRTSLAIGLCTAVFGVLITIGGVRLWRAPTRRRP
jgi:hypothetical protein